MATEIEYALMAGGAYISTRPDDVNKFPVPVGWVGTRHDNPPGGSGFEAVTFINGATIATSTEIVISYAGTYPGDILGDQAANIGLGLGRGSVQLIQAAEYYLQVKALNPNVTLTGHSLGGGLAALIGVFFGETAVTFDQAPFAKTALFKAQSLLDDLLAKTSGGGAPLYTSAQLQGLTNFIQLQQTNGGIPNSGLVTNINVQGEFLSGGPWNIPDRIGTTIKNISNSAPGVSGFDLHAQALLAAFLQSEKSAAASGNPQQTLSEVTKKLTDLLGMIFDDNLFDRPTDKADPSLLEHLMRHEAGVQGSFVADAMVTRFASDLWKLAQDGGLTMKDGNPNDAALNFVSKTLIAFAMQKYYEETTGSAGYKKEFFTDLTTLGGAGGIQFDMFDISTKLKDSMVNANGSGMKLSDAKGFDLYFKNYLASTVLFTPAERTLIQSLLPYMRDWYIQAGAAALNATDTLNRGAFMLGGSGADMLTGGAGADLLVGNGGNDTLTGGLGNDYLLGGADNDTYQYTSGDGLDTILDFGGEGSIIFDGVTLSGGAQYGDNRVYRSADKKHTYTLVDSTLIIDGNIIVERFAANQLNLNLSGPTALTNPAITNTINGDISPTDIDPGTAGIQAQRDGQGNLIGTAQAYEDILVGGVDNERIVSGDLDDNIGGRGGDDWIETGTGNDHAFGDEGNDLIEGGVGADILIGGTGDDRLYADTQISVAQAISNGNAQTGSRIKGDWLSGEAGEDTLIAGAGNDVLAGGGGADLLIAGAGDDNILGDADYQPQFIYETTPRYFVSTDLRTDWYHTSSSMFNWGYTDIGDIRTFAPVEGTEVAVDGGADVIYAGQGNDWVWGHLGNDVIFGEAGDDMLVGGAGSDIILGGDNNDLLFGEGSGVTAQASGNDYLDGGDGIDELQGGAGDDILIGGKNDDRLFGEAGCDTYIIRRGEGRDTIVDTKADGNILRFEGVNASDVTLRLGSLMLDLGNGDAVHIEGFDQNDVFNSSTINSFEFADGTLTTNELLVRGFDLDGTNFEDIRSGEAANDASYCNQSTRSAA